jgi:hypothetical protein
LPTCYPIPTDPHGCLHESGVVYSQSTISKAAFELIEKSSALLLKWIPLCFESIKLDMLNGLFGNPSNSAPGYSFIDIVENRFPDLKFQFFKQHSGRMNQSSLTPDPNMLDELLNDMTNFSMALTCLIYITGGAPPRGTELRCCFRNVDDFNSRDIIFENGRFVSIPQWNKTNNLLGNRVKV